MLEWLSGNWDALSVAGGLAWTGASVWAHVRAKRAETSIEVNKQHRELWSYYEEHPEIHGLKEQDRDMAARPLTEREARFAAFLFNHHSVTFRAARAGVLSQPKAVRADVRSVMAYPAFKSAWERFRPYHDPRFVRSVERALRG